MAAEFVDQLNGPLPVFTPSSLVEEFYLPEENEENPNKNLAP